MKENKYTQCILCEGETFQEAVDKFNSEMQRYSSFNPTFERAGEAFLIYVKLTALAPETVVEAKHLEGCAHSCEDCKFCERIRNRNGETDRRKKFAYCMRDGEQFKRKVRVDQIVCDEFYTDNLELRKEG